MSPEDERLLPPLPQGPGASTKALLLTVLLVPIGFLAGGLLGHVFGGWLDHLVIREDCDPLDSGCVSGLVQGMGELYGIAFGSLLAFRVAKRLTARFAPTYHPIIRRVSAAQEASRSKRYGTLAIVLALIPLVGMFPGWILGVRAINAGLNARRERLPQLGVGLGMIAIAIASWNVQATNQSL